MNKETEQLEKLKRLAEDADSDFFDDLDEEWINWRTEVVQFSDSLFKEYLSAEEEYKDRVRELCPNTFAEKWKTFKTMALQVLEQSCVMHGSNEAIIELSPFVSDMVYTSGALWIKIDSFKPEMLCAFANVCIGEYTYEGGGLYCARWEGSDWSEENTKDIMEILEKRGYKVL